MLYTILSQLNLALKNKHYYSGDIIELMSKIEDGPQSGQESKDNRKLDVFIGFANKVISGELIFGDTVRDDLIKIRAEFKDSEALTDDYLAQIDDLIGKIPTAEITNMCNRAAELADTGDLNMARTWLSDAKTRIVDWTENEAITADVEAELDAQIDQLLVDFVSKQETNSDEINSEDVDLLDQPEEVRKVNVYTGFSDKIMNGEMVFGYSIYDEMNEAVRDLENLDTGEEHSAEVRKAKHNLLALPKASLTAVFSQIDRNIALGNHELALEWLSEATKQLELWQKRDLLHKGLYSAFKKRESKLKAKLESNT